MMLLITRSSTLCGIELRYQCDTAETRMLVDQLGHNEDMKDG